MIRTGWGLLNQWIGGSANRAFDQTIKTGWATLNRVKLPAIWKPFPTSSPAIPTPSHRAEWINPTKQAPIPEEAFASEIQKAPLIAYSKFYNNQFNSKNSREITLKIISDIDKRIDSEFLQGKKFEKFKQSLIHLREEGIRLSTGEILEGDQCHRSHCINPSSVYSFVIRYVETMYELLKSQDSNIRGTYYTDFAKDFLKNLCLPGSNTQLFFTFKSLNEQYFIDVRPLCLYPVHLMSLPNFSGEQPLIPTEKVKGYVESRFIDFREVTFHDIGHAHVMSRQDQWLFETCNRTPRELVTEWLRNKEWYMDECNQLEETNYPLSQAVKLYLFDVTHDRGYQFYLPILKQQLKAVKNLENLKARVLRGEFDVSYGRGVVQHLDEARKWLLDRTDQFLVRDNLDKIEKYRREGYVVKQYPDIESCAGTPTQVTICKNGKILVHFDSNGATKTTSLYEIELISLPVEETMLTEERIGHINQRIHHMKSSNDEFIQLDENVLNGTNTLSVVTQGRDSDLKKIEIYKLERLLNLIKNKKRVKFSVSKLPDIHDSNELSLHGQKLTIDTGLVFNLDEISVENKPRTTLKYINLEPNDRFVSETLLRDSYIQCPNSKNPRMNPYVSLTNGLEMGIVDTKKHVQIAKGVSSLLSRSIDRAKDIYGGYLPSKIVERAQLEYVSPYALSHLWGRSSYRFVLSRKVTPATREMIGTALITKDEDTLLFFTNKYNNLRFSSIRQSVDFDLSVNGQHKWFEQFDMPKTEDYKPHGYNQLANFAIESVHYRGLGLGKLLIHEIVKNYALHSSKANIQHSQPLIRGKGLFQIADPSWREYMLKIGFQQRAGAETFYLDREWAKLPPVTMNGKKIDHKSYNRMYGIPQMYEASSLGAKNTNLDLIERIPRVIELANSGKAKLQYFQLIYMFD